MTYPSTVEFRPRSKDAPDGVRVFFGRPESAKEAKRLLAQKKLLQRLGRRGEWDVVRAVQERHLTAEALAALVDQYGFADYRAHLDIRPTGGPTLREHVADWLESLGRTSTRGTYTHNIRHLVDRYGDMTWWEIDGTRITEARTELENQGLASSTRRTILGAWGAFFSWAIAREEDQAQREGRKPHISASPVRKSVERRATPRGGARHRFFTRDEFRRLIAVAPDPMKAQYAALVLCALRISELFHLPPAHVHLPTHVHVGPWGDWAPKGHDRYTAGGVGDIPLERSVLLPLLEEYAELYAGEDVFFVNPNTGERWRYEAFRNRFDRDVRAAGMTVGQRTPDGVTPHTCRHTLPSWMAQQDVQLLKIASVIRDTVQTVIKHYAHLVPQDLDDAVNGVLE